MSAHPRKPVPPDEPDPIVSALEQAQATYDELDALRRWKAEALEGIALDVEAMKETGARLGDRAADHIRRLAADALRWTQEKPSAPGLYLRSNPPAQAIFHREHVELVEGELLRVTQSGLQAVATAPDRFWWFGPIPRPPWEDR